MSDPEHLGFCGLVFMAATEPTKLPIAEEEILRRILYETIRRFCEDNPRRRHAVINAASPKGIFKNSVAQELKEIAWQEVIPKLSKDDRANFDRTLRSRQGPPPTRPPAGPRSSTHSRNRRGPGR